MRKIVEYKIISGNVVEIRRTYMNARSIGKKGKRAARVAGNTSEAKIRANETSSAMEFARRINANIKPGDIHLVLKYTDEQLPGSYEAAETYLEKFFRKYRAAFRKACGRSPMLMWVTGNWSPKHKRPARLHHHVIMDKEGLQIALELWQGGGYRLESLDHRLDHSDLAAYLVENVKDRPGKKKWHSSRGLIKPIYTEPEEVDDIEDIQAEKDSVIKDFNITADEEGRVISAYLRCALEVKPRVRGGKIVIPKKVKVGGRKKEVS